MYRVIDSEHTNSATLIKSDSVAPERSRIMDFAPSPRIQITSLETRGLLVEITGPLTALDRDLEDAIAGYLNAGRRDFILRMSGVTNIDSIGLGQLISV